MDLRAVDVHSLRYTFITEMIAAGADVKTVQYLAGHKSIQTTLAVYAQVRDGNTDDAIQLLPW
ncbi:MAG: tyrosine-type recombinase/integrase [Planctomycetes bacterium]|nr:tyrosine-type recombinase/integrase [Planctomycetota bacterium]